MRDSLRIVFLNTWGGRIYEPLIEYLQKVDADVYCLQEVMSTPELPDDALFPESDTEYFARVNLYRNIEAALPEHHGMFFPFCRGFINDSQQTVDPIQYGIATFVRRTMPITASRSEFTIGQFRREPYPERSPMSRNMHAMRVYHPLLGREYLVAHTHGLWLPAGKGDCPERDKQMCSIVSLLQAMSKKDDAVIFGGDLNLLPDSRTFADLRRIGLADLVTGRNITDTRTSYYPQDKPSRYADYAFVSETVKTLSFRALADPEVSDHRPLILECR